MSLFQMAYTEALLAGALAGLVGVFVVLRRRAFFTVALTHATFPGAVLATVLGIHVLVGTTGFALVLVAIMIAISRLSSQGSQVASGIVLTFGFALGAVLISATPSLPIRVESFLTGSILTVNSADLWGTGIVLLATVILVMVFLRPLVFSTFDPRGYRAAGYRGWPVETLVLLMITATVVTIMPVLGAILSIALVVAPALAAKAITGNVIRMLWVAPLLGAVSGVAGLLLSSLLGASAGAAIALTAAGVLILALGVSALYSRIARSRVKMVV